MSMSEQPVLTPDGKLLVLSGHPFEEKRLITWDFADGRELASGPLEATNEDDRTCARGFADAGKTFLILTREGKLRGWDLVQGKARAVSQARLSHRARPGGHQEQDAVLVKRATFLAGGKKLAALVALGGLQMIDTASGKELFHTEGGDLIVASPDERILAVSDGVSGVRLRRDRRFGHDRPAAFLLTSTVSGKIRLLEAETGREIQSMTVEGSEVWAMAFAPDGKTLAATTGWETGRIHFYRRRQRQGNADDQTPPLRSPALAFTPDGSRLVSGMADGSILVWDVRAAR